ncbi:polymorphic outer membrane protein middle domain-containing protein [Chlamydia vaughanii]|uniref:polymorphic outer membrane protein middle domain-containing protein n=1 Tax=Chlamydia vaughanii TaxID=3112552 RepID=UPI0032B21532
MKQMFFWKCLIFSSLIQASHLSATEIVLPLSGTHSGEDPEIFTMLTISPQGTNYTLRGEFILHDFFGSGIHKCGGAFRNLAGNLTFSSTSPLAAIKFKNLTLDALGAGVYSESLLTFEKLKSITVENNQSSGGVFTSGKDMLFTQNGSLMFQNNLCYGSGGAILFTGAECRIVFSEQKGTISFINNRTGLPKDTTLSGHNGGAISGQFGTILFDENQEVLFQDNGAEFGGGIYNVGGSVEFTRNKGAITFSNNTASESGGAIYTEICRINKQEAPVIFSKNSAKRLGGAICATNTTLKNNESTILFSQNSAEAGGAIAAKNCSITALYPITFSNNSAGSLGGGAIYLSGKTPRLYLHAHSADITFSGNTAVTCNNAITIKDSSAEISLLANKNHALIFYDPIRATEKSFLPVNINTTESPIHCGSIIFSGEKLTPDCQDKNNKTSIFNQPVHLNNGSLSIKNGAVLAVQEFKQNGGLLNLGPGSMLTSYNSSGKDLVISSIGFCLDEANSHLPAEIRSGAAEIKLLGSPKIHDPDKLFYDNHLLASTTYQMKMTFKSDKNVNTDDFALEDIPILQDSYGYQGVWKFSLSQGKSQKHKILRALWSPTGAFVLRPEKEGSLVPSSVWTTFSGMHVSSDAILDNYVNNNTLLPMNHLCIFGGVVSSIMEQDSSSYNNFSVTHAGHNIGIKLPFSPNTVVCATFTQLRGSSHQNNLPGKSHSHMLLGTLATFKNWRALSLRSSVSYAEETHIMKHTFSKKELTRGSWKNQGLRGTVGVSYAYPKGIRCLKITPFVDLEYTVITQNPFIETGYDPRYFSSSHLTNLALPTGVALEMRLFGVQYSLFTQFSMAYIKDLHRDNPLTTASLILNQHSWKVSGVSIGQEAMSLKFRSTLRYRCATAYLGISTTQREGNNLSGDAFGGLSLSF